MSCDGHTNIGVTLSRRDGDRPHVFNTDSFCAHVPSGAPLELANAMSEISEECICAGWIMGNEHILWGLMTGESTIGYGHGEPTEMDLKILRELHARAGGWIYLGSDGVLHFASTEEWNSIRVARCSTGHDGANA